MQSTNLITSRTHKNTTKFHQPQLVSCCKEIIARVVISDGSVNSCSWKIHTLKKCSAFQGITLHFSSQLWNLVPFIFDSRNFSNFMRNRAKEWLFFTQNHITLSFIDFTLDSRKFWSLPITNDYLIYFNVHINLIFYTPSSS